MLTGPRVRLVLRGAFIACARCSDACAATEGAARAVCLFLSRLALGKIAELEGPRRHPKAFGTRLNLLSGTPSSVSCPRSDACRTKGACKSIAALQIALGGLPDKMPVEVDPNIRVSAKTVGELRKLTALAENLATPLTLVPQ
jgi:hypothetical protein